MFAVLLLVFLSLCNAQWPPQNIGLEDSRPAPKSPDQPGNPYDDAADWLVNILNSKLIQRSKEDGAIKTPKILELLNLKLPSSNNHHSTSIKALLSGDSDSTSSSESDSSYESDEDWDGINYRTKPLKSLRFPVSSDFFDIVENVTLSTKSSLKNGVIQLANQSLGFRNETDAFVSRLNLFYIHLPLDESANVPTVDNSMNYGLSVVLRFLFEFYSMFRKFSSQPMQHHLRLTHSDVYNTSFDQAITVMKEKRDWSPLRLAATLRRAFDILKSILDESVYIVQTACNVKDEDWRCTILYLLNLAEYEFDCHNAWAHAFVHILVMKTMELKSTFIYSVLNVHKAKNSGVFKEIFDIVMETISELKEDVRQELTIQGIVYTVLVDLQEHGLLNCTNINDGFFK